MRGRRPSPLPPRDGVDATRVVLRSGPDHTIGECLLATRSLADLSGADLADRAARGEIVDSAGSPVALDARARRNASVYLYRDLPVETPVPFDLEILYRDDDILVVDKPHFLATMPRGRHVTQTALVRLRRSTGNDALAPAHRLDRVTAGVLLFTARPEVRAAYHQIFADRRVAKTYRALAPARPDLATTATVADRIEKRAGDLRARVVPGPVNAISEITLTEPAPAGDLGVYHLVPRTGRTHQLRVHMAGLGVPIVGDPLYPEVDPVLAARPDAGDFSTPLRLVAHSLRFTDPLSGREREFVSGRSVTDDPATEGGPGDR